MENKIKIPHKQNSLQFVFGYGSLINPKSVQTTINKEIDQENLIITKLEGYIRKWDLAVWTKTEDVNNETVEIPIVYLNLKRQEGSWANGILIPVSNEELFALDSREIYYDRINVSKFMDPTVDIPVFTYIGKEKYTRPPPTSHVLFEYEAVIHKGLKLWGKSFEQDYIKSTIPHKFSRKKGKYKNI